MDGYALIAPQNIEYPIELRVIGESAAGKRFEGKLNEGAAVRIFTGAPMPEGADCIVIQEDTERSGDKLTIQQGLDKGRHIRRAGLDFAPGDTVLPIGRELDAPALSLAAASGNATVSFLNSPGLPFSPQDELVPPGVIPGPDQIVASNSLGIAEIVRRAGGKPEDMGIIIDDPAKIESAIDRVLDDGIDVLVTIGEHRSVIAISSIAR